VFNKEPSHEYVMGGGGVKIYSQGFVAWALGGADWSASRHGSFTLWDRAHGTHYIEGCVGPSQSELCV
jgi:hypothetical protein